ncbi:MAG TPA: hypothetical protein VKX49_11755 [Bryobacteraceae bacterium]|nr:hypothetical protein [Bryobacteraceae bacterium]
MNDDQRDLLHALRGLAAAGPQEAPARLEQQLLMRMRARAHRRRVVAWASAAVTAAAAAVSILFWTWAPSSTGLRGPSEKAAVAAEQGSTDAALSDATASFYPLPDAEALPPLETSMVVRVQMQGSALRLLGYPVDEDLSSEPVQADVLLGQDGLARGLRLIQE